MMWGPPLQLHAPSLILPQAASEIIILVLPPSEIIILASLSPRLRSTSKFGRCSLELLLHRQAYCADVAESTAQVALSHGHR